ncbi:MAG: radical SAM protein [Deltaproteobacteria bacterium]|nr:radical SAM protein [Deltaproteobacteria bacterium]
MKFEPGKQEEQAVFGPVPSRRLGLSLGVDLLWFKTCPLDCVYCELGPTTVKTACRAEFRPVDQVLAQVEERLAELAYTPQYLTLAGSGEPTLHLGLGRAVERLASLGAGEVAVLTNGVLCSDPAVRRDLAGAHLVVPSLDAVSEEVFQRVNRPARGLSAARVVEGLALFRREYAGRLWLEILFVAGVNDTDQEVEGLVAAVRRIAPDLVQVNTVVRPPAEPGAGAVSNQRLAQIAGAFSVPAEVIAPPEARAAGERGELSRQVVEMTRRRPCTLADIVAFSGLPPAEAARLVEELASQGRVVEERFGDGVYFRGI